MNIPRSITQPRKTSWLLQQVKAHYNYYEYSSFYKPTTQTSLLLHRVKGRYNYYEYSSFYKPATQNKFAFTHQIVFVILFFVLLIGQLSTQFYKCRFVFPKWQEIFTWIYKNIYFYRRLFSSKFANCKCTLGTKSVMHLRTLLACSEIIYISFEKVRDIFLQDF